MTDREDAPDGFLLEVEELEDVTEEDMGELESIADDMTEILQRFEDEVDEVLERANGSKVYEEMGIKLHLDLEHQFYLEQVDD